MLNLNLVKLSPGCRHDVLNSIIKTLDLNIARITEDIKFYSDSKAKDQMKRWLEEAKSQRRIVQEATKC